MTIQTLTNSGDAYTRSPVARADESSSPIAASALTFASAGVTGTRWFNLTGGTLKMSTKRNILLAATALVALAATPALAQKSIGFANTDGVAANAVEAIPYNLVRQAALPGAAGTGHIEFTINASNASAFPSGNSIVTVELSGGTFNGAITDAVVIPGGVAATDCTLAPGGPVTRALSGTPSTTSASFVVSRLDLCDGATAITRLGFRIPV